MIRRIIITFFQLLVIAFLAFVCHEAWLAYQQEKLDVLYEKEGQSVQVRINNVTTEKRNWKDYIGNSKYVDFSYKGRLYHLRILQDSAWIGEGSTVWLLYHPRLDLFWQPGIGYSHPPDQNVSKLVHWTVVSLFSSPDRLLFATIALGVLVAMLLFSVIFKITGLKFYDVISTWLINLCFFGMAIYFTWDVWENHQYYHQLKTGGAESGVVMLHKNKLTIHRNQPSTIPTYYFTADVRYQNREREIMISSDDYYRLSPGDQLSVIYNASMDDMMSKDYSLGYGKIIFIVILWVIVVYIVRKKS